MVYTKEDIAKLSRIVYLSNTFETETKEIWLTEPYYSVDYDTYVSPDYPAPFPDGEDCLTFTDLEHPHQYPWPEPGDCIVYKIRQEVVKTKLDEMLEKWNGDPNKKECSEELSSLLNEWDY